MTKLTQAAFVAMVALLSVWSPLARAQVVVAGCTEQDLRDALAGGGEIIFDVDCAITITGTIVISNDTTIDATGHTVMISGNNLVRVFSVDTNVNLTLLNLKIANGRSANGGGLYINAGATLTASNCIFSGNRAIGSDGSAGAVGSDDLHTGKNGGNGGVGKPGLGGAIYNLGEVTLVACQFLTNTAAGGSGGKGGDGGNGDFNGGNGGNGAAGAMAYGGGVHNAGILTLMSCAFENNSATGGHGGDGGAGGDGSRPGLPGHGGAGGAGSGAGLCNLHEATVVDCTFSDNASRGGDSAAGGTQVNGNGATGPAGGAGLGGGICNQGTNTMTNCTFFANTVTGGAGGDGGPGDFNGGNGGNGGLASGGGLYNSGSTFVSYCTFSSGSATGGAGGLAGSGSPPGADGATGAKRGGNVARNSGGFTLKNSIVAYSASGNNGFGTFNNGGHNISSDGSPAFPAGNGSTNNTNPKLGSLANNGGFTKTVALLAGSPAIDKIDTNTSECLAFDQRGVSRPLGPKCDIGAYEFFPTFSIQGRITEGTNGIHGISVSAETNGIAVAGAALSDTNGYYLISNLASNTYAVAPLTAGIGFNPASTNVTLGPSATNVDFVLNPVQITAIAATSNGLFQLSFLGGPSRTYRIEASTNLTVWQTVFTNTAQTNGFFEFIDSLATNLPIRFYRTRTP